MTHGGKREFDQQTSGFHHLKTCMKMGCKSRNGDSKLAYLIYSLK